MSNLRQVSQFDEVFLDRIELARRWGVHPNTVRNMEISGRIQGTRFGSSVRYAMSAILETERQGSRKAVVA